ncbi:ComEA family DNA-binding protein [Phaeacidiphilus oryzae]|uniref:ComEA family DNA-binding protein n=1 Tax=Phaeacidiphilus oryzae TaxID=348818 RepID=UPI000A4D995A|nr:ComEA family DNA-binding protein [Phaeacidiphilus oryzae]
MNSTLTAGAAARRENADLVRRRMATLFDAPAPRGRPGAAFDEPEESAEPGEHFGPDEHFARGEHDEPDGPDGPDGPALGSDRRRLRPRPGALGRMRLALLERCDLDRRAMVGLAVLVVLASCYAVQHFWLGRPEPVGVPERQPVATAAGMPGPGPGPVAVARGGGAAGGAVTAGAPSGAALVVDVAGRVARPGVHALPPGARVEDALAAAGGALPGTDLTAINLARRLADGEEIVVGQPAPAAGSAEAPGGGAAGSAAGAAGAAGAAAAGPVSLSTATVQQLDGLPGVGPVLAQRILQYRDRHGGFRSVDELRKVPGLGARRFADLRNLVRP